VHALGFLGFPSKVYGYRKFGTKTLGFTTFDVQLLIMKDDITEILLKVAINTIKPISL
jgi:hypothetical protein